LSDLKLVKQQMKMLQKGEKEIGVLSPSSPSLINCIQTVVEIK
jgi:hypothetical protein